MKNWRVVRVNKGGTLDVAEMGFWTKKGAQEAATHLNTTFGSMAAMVNALVGHNYFATHASKIPALVAALARAKEEQEKA